jgi:hypothetical protein
MLPMNLTAASSITLSTDSRHHHYYSDVIARQEYNGDRITGIAGHLNKIASASPRSNSTTAVHESAAP